ncbi:MAG: response regulator transcription factor [Gammaproteobacteria bacterium]|nr:response regulator transcription factor [Gammaproteobacteria bacterium]
MSQTVAIVEDDPDQRASCAEALRRRGYRVLECAGVDEARARLAGSPPDLAILDIMLGDAFDGGFTLCRELLAHAPDLPVLFLSSRSDDIDRISGLRLGACDYQVKPVSLEFLVEKVAALLRMRAPPHAAGRGRAHGPLELDSERCAASWRGDPLPLTLTEYRVLEAIVEPGHARGASYDRLAAATRQTVVTNNTINTHVRNLRHKFRELDPGFGAIENVYGFGYRWES